MGIFPAAIHTPSAAFLCDEPLREWFAVFTRHQNEHAVVRHLDMRGVESFLPTYETVHTWRNRRKKKICLPLFPSYLFVRIDRALRASVLSCPGALALAGNSAGPIPIPDAEIEFLRAGACAGRVEPFADLVVGERVRIARGPMEGVEGTLVRRRDNTMRFVLTVELLNRSVSVEIAAGDVEPIAEPKMFRLGGSCPRVIAPAN